METKKTTKPYPAELRDRAVRMVREHANDHASEWATICSIAEKVGCNAETLRLWVRRAERDRGVRSGPRYGRARPAEGAGAGGSRAATGDEILRKASAYFAQAELDRRFKP